jgi:hypothetical protein
VPVHVLRQQSLVDERVEQVVRGRQGEPLRRGDLLGAGSMRLVGHPEKQARRARDRLDARLGGGLGHRLRSSPWYKMIQKAYRSFSL